MNTKNNNLRKLLILFFMVFGILGYTTKVEALEQATLEYPVNIDQIRITYPTDTAEYSFTAHLSEYPTQSGDGGSGSGSCDTWIGGYCSFRISVGVTNWFEIHPDYWVLLGDYYAGASTTANITSFINTFSYSTTTQLAHITGYWNATTTPYISEKIEIWVYDERIGNTQETFLTATTTGTFDFYVFMAGGIKGYNETGTTTANWILKTSLYQQDNTNNLDPFGGTSSEYTYFDSDILYFNEYNYVPPVAPYEKEYSFAECTWAKWDFGLCFGEVMSALFIPREQEWKATVDNLHNGILSKWPWGYIDDLAYRLASTTTGTLTIIDATLPNGIAGAGSSIQLDLNGVLDPFLNATTSQFNNISASSTQTMGEITMGYWEKLIWLLTLLYILVRIMGQRVIPKI